MVCHVGWPKTLYGDRRRPSTERANWISCRRKSVSTRRKIHSKFWRPWPRPRRKVTIYGHMSLRKYGRPHCMTTKAIPATTYPTTCWSTTIHATDATTRTARRWTTKADSAIRAAKPTWSMWRRKTNTKRSICHRVTSSRRRRARWKRKRNISHSIGARRSDPRRRLYPIRIMSQSRDSMRTMRCERSNQGNRNECRRHSDRPKITSIYCSEHENTIQSPITPNTRIDCTVHPVSIPAFN